MERERGENERSVPAACLEVTMLIAEHVFSMATSGLIQQSDFHNVSKDAFDIFIVV